jgi:hypothetical protein
MLITDGILRMRNRNGSDHWEFMNPGEIYEIEVDIWSTSYIWNTGHRIRVEISSSNYPRFLNNPNTADSIHANTTSVIAQNTLYVDNTHPSNILLPEIVLPLKSTAPSLLEMTVKNSNKKRTQFTFEGQIIDSENDMVYIQFDWNDGSRSGWLGPFNSGENFSINHEWKNPGHYTVQYIVKDETGTISEWRESDSISVTHAVGYRSHRLKNYIISHPDQFSVLDKLLGYLEKFDHFSNHQSSI